MPGLREIANADCGIILEDSVTGFGWPIELTNPDGVKKDFTGFGDDISALIDPETGQAVSGRLASVAIHMASLKAKGFEVPRGISSSNKKPWIVEFDDVNGTPFKFKVQQSNPDRMLGLITMMLEIYE